MFSTGSKVFSRPYLSNEGVSLLENAAHIGLPVPDKLKDVLVQLHNRSGKDNTSSGDGE